MLGFCAAANGGFPLLQGQRHLTLFTQLAHRDVVSYNKCLAPRHRDAVNVLPKPAVRAIDCEVRAAQRQQPNWRSRFDQTNFAAFWAADVVAVRHDESSSICLTVKDIESASVFSPLQAGRIKNSVRHGIRLAKAANDNAWLTAADCNLRKMEISKYRALPQS